MTKGISAFTQTTDIANADRNERQSLDPRKSDLAVDAKPTIWKTSLRITMQIEAKAWSWAASPGCCEVVFADYPRCSRSIPLADRRVGGFNNQWNRSD